MPQDVTQDLGVDARVNLPRCVTVTERVRADHRAVEASTARIQLKAVADGGGRQRIVGQPRTDEYPTVGRRRWPFVAEIPGQGAGHRWKEWQLDMVTRFRTLHAQHLVQPINAVEREMDCFSAAETVRRHQQQHRKIPLSGRRILRHCSQDAADIGPRQRSRRAVHVVARRAHRVQKVPADPATQMEISQKRSERTTAFHHRARRHLASLLCHKRIQIDGPDLVN